MLFFKLPGLRPERGATIKANPAYEAKSLLKGEGGQSNKKKKTYIWASLCLAPF